MLRFDFDFDLSHAFQQVADAVEAFLAKDAEPQPDAPRYSCEQMKSMLQHLCHALHFGDPAWPHIESQAQLAIHYLELTAKSFVWGQKHDDSIVECFLDEGGLRILIRALLTYELPRSIKMQVYQSTCMIAQNAKEELFAEFLKGSDLTDLFLGDPEIDSEEFFQYFLSLIKTLALRVKPESMHLLLTANDFPVLRRALMLSAHGDQLVRTQARAAYLTILRGLLDEEVREKAIQLAQEMLPQLLTKLLWSQWASMAQAANLQNANAFRAAAWEEEDTFEHLTELILLGIPEITELVANTLASTFLIRFGCVVGAPLDNNLWNVQFTDSYDAATPHATSFMIVPSPKSGEVSVSESTMESEGHVDVSGTSAGTGEYLQYLCEEDVKTLELCPFNTALAWRTMASFAQIFRDANLGGVVLPLVELLTLPFVPTWLLTSIWQLKSGQPKELAKFSEELAACAMEDVALSAWPGDVSKLRHEHWRCQLRSAPGLIPRDGEANPFRELLMSTLGTPGCGLSATSFISSPKCELSSLQSISTNTAACMLMAELQALYPPLLEDVQMLARPTMEAKEEAPNNNSGTLGSLAETISWFLTAAGLGNAECSLISSPEATNRMR